jgi:hypothetical protein
MKTIAYFEGIAHWLAHIELFRPDTGIPAATIVAAIAERYAFQVAGISESGNLPAFQTGQFETSSGMAEIKSFEIHPSGLIAQSIRTSLAEAFLTDVLEFLCDQFGFKKDVKFKKTHSSTLVFEPNASLENALGKWMEFLDVLQAALTHEGNDIKMIPMGIRFIGQVNERILADRSFVFERRVGSMSGANRIFTTAPLSTDGHLALLESYETIFASSK